MSVKKKEKFWPRNLGQNTNKTQTLPLFHIQEVGTAIISWNPYLWNGFPCGVIRIIKKNTQKNPPLLLIIQVTKINFNYVGKKLKYTEEIFI